MKNILIAGSTGMIGKLILKEALLDDSISTITIINRKPIGITHPKLREVIHTNFMNLDAVKEVFQNQHICYYCVGVYTGQVPTDEFNIITIDYTKVFANTLKALSPNAAFCFLSGQGADSSEKSKVLFAKAKGIAENYLLSLHFPETYIFRPGYIYPVEKRKEPNMGYRIFRLLYKPVSIIYPNIGLTSHQLAHKMYQVGKQGFSKTILENAEIRA